MNNLKTVKVKTAELVPYAGNAKEHPDWQVGQIVQSIKEFGFNDPIGAWHNDAGEPVIVEGHGRLLAAKELGIDEVPVVFLDHMDDEARRAYTLVHNQTTMNTGFDELVLNAELNGLEAFSMEDYGFSDATLDDWFSERSVNDTSRQEGNEEYNEFLDKFEIKKTTDDCYTPDLVYDAVADWVAEEYDLDRKDFMRPFYPGGDYENEEYPAGAIVVDNPPFSMLSQILNFYCKHGVKFFLFAPTLTLFSSGRKAEVCYIPTKSTITYENGAVVSTSFVTNLETDNIVRSAPALAKAVEKANKQNQDENREHTLKYAYPSSVITSSKVAEFSFYGVDFAVRRDQVARITQLDEQKKYGKAIFGGGFLLSSKARAEAEKARAEAAAKALADDIELDEKGAVIWPLSPREKEIIAELDAHSN